MKHPDSRAKPSPVRLALRETARDLRDRRFWIVAATAVAVVAFAGPFRTLEALGLPARLAYWGTVGALSWLMMTALVRTGLALAPPRWPEALVAALAGLAGTAPMMGLVALGNLAAGMGLPPGGFWALAPYVGPPAVGISVLAVLLAPASDAPAEAPAATSTADAPPPAGRLDPPGGLLARLPPALGRDVVALQAQDHYVRVVTPRGGALVLMRMADAAAELSHLDGLQVHRSWWVNLAHVTALAPEENGRLALLLDTGLRVPVPRSRRAEVRRIVAAHLARPR